MTGNKFETLDQLLAANQDEETIVKLFDFLSDISEYGEKIEVLNPHQRVVYYIEILETEINNGGFNQYFFNSYGNFAHETIAALSEIKAHKTSEILKLAVAAFPNKTAPKDREERQNIMDDIEDAANLIWEELDQKFYLYDDDINGLLINYIKLNRASF
jgi:hypothetical protein